MVWKLIELEENILRYKEQLRKYCDDVETLLLQIETILDFGMSAHKLQLWLQKYANTIEKLERIVERIEDETSSY